MTKPRNPPLFVSFPTPATNITLRDLFAAAALAGLYAGDAHPDADCDPLNIDHELRAITCYAQADAMLAERAKGGGS